MHSRAQTTVTLESGAGRAHRLCRGISRDEVGGVRESAVLADPMSSHDLEDLITVVAGRAGIVEDVHAAPDEIRHFIREQTAAFLGPDWAPRILEGNLPDARQCRAWWTPLSGAFSS